MFRLLAGWRLSGCLANAERDNALRGLHYRDVHHSLRLFEFLCIRREHRIDRGDLRRMNRELAGVTERLDPLGLLAQSCRVLDVEEWHVERGNARGGRGLYDAAAGEEHWLPSQRGVKIGRQIAPAESDRDNGRMRSDRLGCAQATTGFDQSNNLR